MFDIKVLSRKAAPKELYTNYSRSVLRRYWQSFMRECPRLLGYMRGIDLGSYKYRGIIKF